MDVQPTLPEVIHPYIERRPGVQGGRAVIKGSRFPVSSIVQNYRRGMSVEEILFEFPHLKPAEVHDALSYYYDHREEIRDEIRLERQQVEDFRRSNTSVLDSKPGSGERKAS